jgi:Zn-finger nucleic acid-binding protein
LRLVACRACHAQYDVTHVDAPTLDCRCGQAVATELPAAVDARVQRCGACGAILADGAAACEYCRAAVVRDARALSLICPECYARNAETARFCTGCGLAFLPEPLPSEPEDPPSCPACESPEPLAARGVGGVWVRECGKCNGLWVAGDRIDALIQRSVDGERERAATGAARTPRAPRRVDVRFAYRSCPVCGHPMQRKNFGKRSGVIVDWCGGHGTWLDKDELEQIATFIAAGGLRSPGAGAGLSEGGRMSYEQARAMVMVQNELERERQKQERRGHWLESSPASRSGVDLVIDLLGKLLD